MIDYLTLLTLSVQHVRLVWMYLEYKRRSRSRLCWVKPHLQDHVRDVYGGYGLFTYFYYCDYEKFRKMCRMTPGQFDKLEDIVGFRLLKRSLRRLLPPRFRLAVTLNFLAHGDSIETTTNLFLIGYSTAQSIIKEVSYLIWELLSPIYLRLKTSQEWKLIAQGFRVKWDFPNCIGAMDGKEIRIQAPPYCGSVYYCYKKFHSFKLLAACDAYYRFAWVDIGDYGSVSDVSAFQHTEFYSALEKSEADLPAPCRLPRSTLVLPHFFLTDEIFPLKSYSKRPYARHRRLTRKERNFNYRLSRARNCIEDAFGILTGRWRILHTPMSFKVKTWITIVEALVCLHNMILEDELPRKENARHYAFPPRDVELPEIPVLPEENVVVDNEEDEIPHHVIQEREMLSDYFMSEKPAPFDKYISRNDRTNFN